MKSKITSKFQITIPKEVRDRLKLSKHDVIEWKLEKGLILVEPVKKPFSAMKGVVRVGGGDINADIQKARRFMAEKKK